MFVRLISAALSVMAISTMQNPLATSVGNGSMKPQVLSNRTNLLELQRAHRYQIHDDKGRVAASAPEDPVHDPYIHNPTNQKPETKITLPISPPKPVPLPVVNRPLQVSLLALIMMAAVLANGSLILNISSDSLKLRMVHFLLIRHVCITDCLGAVLVLPVPILVVVKGSWNFGEHMCSAVSSATAACWTMHLLAVALYRADRVLAVWLPTGRYPILSVRTTNILLVVVWCLTGIGSYGATVLFGATFQPALALCIPDVPLIFFVLVFAAYCIGLVGLTTGYVLAFARRRRRKRKKERQLVGTYPELQHNAPFEPTPNKYIDEEIEDFDDNTSRKHRKRRALSDQLPVLDMQTNVCFPDTHYTHRRTWSESATSYRPSTKLTPLITKATQVMSPCSVPSLKDSCSSHLSIPVNESPVEPPQSWDSSADAGSCQGYIRLAEEESSSSDSSFAPYPIRLLHSLSFDERGLTFKTEGVGMVTVARSTQSKSFGSVDSVAKNRLKFLSSHFIPSCPLRRPRNHIPSYTTYPRQKERPKGSETEPYLAGGQAWSLDRKEIQAGKECVRGMLIRERGGENPCFGTGSNASINQDNSELVKVSMPALLEPVFLTCPDIQASLDVSVQSLSLCGDGRPADATSLASRVISESSEQTEQKKRPPRKRRVRTRLKHFRPKVKKTGPAKRALASYAVSVGHLLLYLPAMFVVGLQGSSLPPGVALFCGIVVYCDFLIQPIALLLVSHRLRLEVEKTVASLLFRKGKTISA